MKIAYLQRITNIGNHKTFVMVTEKHSITLWDTKIEVEEVDPDESFKSAVGWYIDNWEMEECKKSEFDDFYIKTANHINKVMTSVAETNLKKIDHEN